MWERLNADLFPKMLSYSKFFENTRLLLRIFTY